MISSQIDSSIGKREFELLSDQEHMEEVWAVMQPRLEKYANNYLEGVSHYLDLPSPGDSFSALLAEMIRKNDKAHGPFNMRGRNNAGNRFTAICAYLS